MLCHWNTPIRSKRTFFKFTTSSNNNMADARTTEPPATVSFKPRKKKYENLLKVIFLGAQNNKILDVR